MRLAKAGVLSGATFAANLIWEVAQAQLYAGYPGFWPNLLMCARASVGDVVIVAAIYGVFALAYRDVDWPVRSGIGTLVAVAIAGGLIGIVIEWWALSTGRWRYAGMPLLPIVNVGLLPVLQMAILPTSLFAAYAFYRHRRGQSG